MARVTLLTGPKRRRRWSAEDRERILTAAFAPGATVADIGRQFEVSTSLIYKWREQAMTVRAGAAFAPAVLAAQAPRASAPLDATAIIVELANGTRLKIAKLASPELVAAALRALR